MCVCWAVYLQGSRPLPQQLFKVRCCSGHQLLGVILLHSIEVLVFKKNLVKYREYTVFTSIIDLTHTDIRTLFKLDRNIIQNFYNFYKYKQVCVCVAIMLFLHACLMHLGVYTWVRLLPAVAVSARVTSSFCIWSTHSLILWDKAMHTTNLVTHRKDIANIWQCN